MLTLISLPSTLTLLDVPFLRLDRHGELLELSDAARLLLADKHQDAHDQIRPRVPSIFEEWHRTPSSPRTWHASVLLGPERLDARLTVIVSNTGIPEALLVFVPVAPSALGRALADERRYEDIERILSRYRVTPREREVAHRLLAGKSTADISTEVGISVHTVRRHTEQLYRKLGVRSRAALIRFLL